MENDTVKNGEPSSDTVINRVSVKPAEFSEATASGWFFIIEAQFQLSNIQNKSTKFYTALAALPATLVQRLSVEILSGKDYDSLKESVLSLVEKSKPELFESLLSTQVLTGRPSACLATLQSTAQKVGVGDEFIRHKFLQSLPASISPVIAAQSTLSLSQLGNLADELITLSVASSSSSRDSFGGISQVRNENRGRGGVYPTARNDNRGREEIHPTVRPFYDNQKSRICRAHIYYADRARTCRQWCAWPTKKDCKIEPNSRAASPAPPRQHGSLNSNSTQ